MKEGYIMHDGYNTLTQKDVKDSAAKAVFDSVAVICCLILYYYFMHVGPTNSTTLNHIMAVICAFMSGFNLSKARRHWKQWNKERKELKSIET